MTGLLRCHCADILQYRINQNLDNIRTTLLVDLPQVGQLTRVEEFVEHQMNFLEQQVPSVELKNLEVRALSFFLPTPRL